MFGFDENDIANTAAAIWSPDTYRGCASTFPSTTRLKSLPKEENSRLPA